MVNRQHHGFFFLDDVLLTELNEFKRQMVWFNTEVFIFRYYRTISQFAYCETKWSIDQCLVCLAQVYFRTAFAKRKILSSPILGKQKTKDHDTLVRPSHACNQHASTTTQFEIWISSNRDTDAGARCALIRKQRHCARVIESELKLFTGVRF